MPTTTTWLIKKYTENDKDNNIYKYNNNNNNNNTNSLYLLVIDFDVIYIINPNEGNSVLTAERVRGCKVRLFNNNQEMNLIVEILENKLLEQLGNGDGGIHIRNNSPGGRQEEEAQQQQLTNTYKEINHFVFQPYFEQDRQLIMKSIIYWQHPKVTQFSYSKLTMDEQQIIVNFTRQMQVKGYDHPMSIFQHNPRCLMLQSNKMALCTIDISNSSLKSIVELEYEDIVDLYLNNVNNNYTNNIITNDFDIDLPISLSFINGFEFIIYVLKSKINMTISYIKGQIARRMIFKNEIERNMLKYDRMKQTHSPTFMRMDGSDNYNDVNEDENNKSINSASIARIIERNSNNNNNNTNNNNNKDNASMFQDDRERYNLNSNTTDLLIERNERPLHPKYLLKEEQVKLFVNTINNAKSTNNMFNARKDANTKTINKTLDKYRYKPSIFEIDSKNGKIAASQEHRELVQKQSKEYVLKKMNKKKLNADKKAAKKAGKIAKKKKAQIKVIHDNNKQVLHLHVNNAENSVESKSIDVKEEISSINQRSKKLMSTMRSNNDEDDHKNYNNMDNNNNINDGSIIYDDNLEDLHHNEIDENSVEESYTDQQMYKIHDSDDIEHNEMIKEFRTKKKVMQSHREDPLMLRRSTLINHTSGTLPIEESNEDSDNTLTKSNVEKHNEIMTVEKSVDNLSDGIEKTKISAAARNFKNLVVIVEDQDVDNDSSIATSLSSTKSPSKQKKQKQGKKLNKKKKKKKKKSGDQSLSSATSSPSSSNSSGYISPRKHLSNALAKFSWMKKKKK